MRNKTDRFFSPNNKDQMRSPGPGTYDGNYTVVKDSGKAFGFG